MIDMMTYISTKLLEVVSLAKATLELQMSVRLSQKPLSLSLHNYYHAYQLSDLL